MTNLTNETVKELFHIAGQIARENYNASYDGAHLLQALLHKDIDLIGFLQSLGKDTGYIYEWSEVRIEEYPTATYLPEEVSPSQKVNNILEEADEIRLKLGLDEITPICILTAIVTPDIVFSFNELKSLPLREHEILQHLNVFTPSMEHSFSSYSEGADKNINLSILNQYCIDRTAQAKNAVLDKIIGREKETRSLIEVLCRRTKPNVIIIGEPGVGKTALIEGFAQEIVKGNVPISLKNAILLELDVSLLAAGT